jgi:radical SAM protein with 4Fe4S-binding SPASM domain
MEIATTRRCTIRPHIGVRRIGDALCLIHQKRKEAWICEGISPVIWAKLMQGLTPDEIISYVTERYRVPLSIVQRDVLNFLEHLWRRQIIDLAGYEEITNEERALLVTDRPHNQNGQLGMRAARSQVICSCVLDLLVPCNLRCRHCYVDFTSPDILPLPDACSYLDQLAAHGCFEVSLTGGEVFLRRDLMDLVAHAEGLGFIIHLLTNGTLITPELAVEVSRYCLSSVQLSLYGVTAAIHERITRKTGSFDKTIRAAKMLIEQGAPVKFLYFIQRDNVEGAFRMAEFARALGAGYGFDTKLVANRNGSTEPLNYGVTSAQQTELYQSGLLKPELGFSCEAATGTARITADGQVFPCALINSQSLGSLKEQPLAEIWASERRQRMRQEIVSYRRHRCRDCALIEECPPCAAMRGFDARNQEHKQSWFQTEGCTLAIANRKFARAARSAGCKAGAREPVSNLRGPC